MMNNSIYIIYEKKKITRKDTAKQHHIAASLNISKAREGQASSNNVLEAAVARHD